MPYEFTVSDVMPAPPGEVYAAWLSSEEHGAMTGAAASIDPRVGGDFEAWDGYITGTTIELEAGRRIVQSWRTTEFDDLDPDSRIEVLFEPAGGGTRVTLRHLEIPDAQSGYEEGWADDYFEPMKAYFAARSLPGC